ncbi:hypothetical protein J2T04_003913 [Chryseobacterium lathyri]|uniref:Uncharacterized protein n=1 Tax=Chryseobacterium lathyri TaxID=395933 RepID=A0ABT9SRB0_9FLAO|nr:hypothetical protein [Chryseobacterium lathyri]
MKVLIEDKKLLKAVYYFLEAFLLIETNNSE